MKLVIRYQAIFRKWYLCHADTYQGAFRPGFETREQAKAFATDKGCQIVYHPKDRLQAH